jgi:hypothetical protein
MNFLFNTLASIRASKFIAKDPIDEQRTIFTRLIAKASNTSFGKDHGFPSLTGMPFPKAYGEFRKKVPIRTYRHFWDEYFGPRYQDMEGKKRLELENVTWPGKIPLFCETSGTTAPTKYIPFSREMFAANKRAALDLTACYLARNPSARLLSGKLLYMAGNTVLSDLGYGVRSGDMSAITLCDSPFYLKPFIAPAPELSALPWEEKLEALAGLLLTERNIRGISGVPPWIMLLLKRCLENGGKPLPELLPNLELIIHGGAGMKPYRKEFDELFPDRPPHFLELLPSSEAFMAFQVFGEEHMRFTPYYGAFFEFVPFESLDERGAPSPHADAVPIEEIETGRRYAVILSTCAGLWRYHIGDTVRFLSRSPLFIEFTGRDRFLDRFEEKVTQGEVEEAVTALNRLEGVLVNEFMVGPDIAERRHIWVLALGGKYRPHPDELAMHLDNALRAMNADYATFRSQGRIHLPIVLPAGRDDIYKWSRDVREKLGGQTKIPHIDPTQDGEMIKSLAGYLRSYTQGHSSCTRTSCLPDMKTTASGAAQKLQPHDTNSEISVF